MIKMIIKQRYKKEKRICHLFCIKTIGCKTVNEKWIGKVDNFLCKGSTYTYGDFVIFTKEDVYDFTPLEI